MRQNASSQTVEQDLESERLQHSWRALYRYLRRNHQPDDAAEIVQEAFCRLAAEAATPKSVTGFLFAVAKNLSIDAHRRRVRQARVLASSAASEAIVAPETELLLRDELRLANAMLADMPRRQREIFVLQAIQGYTYEEIAAEMGVSLAIVRKDLQKAFAACARHARARNMSGTAERKQRRGSLRE